MVKLDALREESSKALLNTEGSDGQLTFADRMTTIVTQTWRIYSALFGGGSAHKADDPTVVSWPVQAEPRGHGRREAPRGPGLDLPVGQPDLHPDLRPGVHRVVGLPGQAASLEPSTLGIKFSLGLLQLGLGLRGALVRRVGVPTSAAWSGMSWLLLGYLLHTTGELCLSPVGLSMVTKLSPQRLVSTVMGGWFLATAFSAYLAAVLASFTGVGGHGGGGGDHGIPAPIETVHVYGGLFGQIAIAAIISAILLAALSPLLGKWMHEDEPMGEGTGH